MDMDEKEILKKSGLNDSQVNVYYTLLTHGKLTPTQIARESGESRENCYLICKKLEELDLIEKTDEKKATYQVLNPSNLEILAEKRRRVVQKNEKILKDNMSSLLDIFYANNEMPGARTIEGLEGIKEVFADVLRCKKDVFLLRTRADVKTREIDRYFLKNFREKCVELGIHTYALTPDSPEGRRHMPNDERNQYYRTMMPIDVYTAPMQMQVYGDKVALLAYGEVVMATIITSPIVAEAMRQILKIMIDFYRESYHIE